MMQREFDLRNIYMHGIHTDYESFDSKMSLEKLEKILSSGYILSRRKRGDTNKNIGGYNGIDYISLCDYSLRNNTYDNVDFYKGYSGYTCFCRDSIALIFPKKKLKVVKPILLSPCIFDPNRISEMQRLGNDKYYRFSDQPDEVQVKNRIDAKMMCALSVPIKYMLTSNIPMNYEDIKKFLEELKKMLEYYNYSRPLYDTTTWSSLENEKKLSLTIKKTVR